MINIWDYANAKRLRIIDIDGKEYSGNLVCIMEKEENGREDDDICIEVGNEIIGFLPSEIASIEVLR